MPSRMAAASAPDNEAPEPESTLEDDCEMEDLIHEGNGPAQTQDADPAPPHFSAAWQDAASQDLAELKLALCNICGRNPTGKKHLLRFTVRSGCESG